MDRKRDPHSKFSTVGVRTLTTIIQNGFPIVKGTVLRQFLEPGEPSLLLRTLRFLKEDSEAMENVHTHPPPPAYYTHTHPPTHTWFTYVTLGR